MRGQSKMQTFYLTQYLKPEFWFWSGDPALASLLDFELGRDDGYARDFASHLLGFLVDRLEAETHGKDARPVEVSEAHAIVHDKDVRNLALPGQPPLLETKPPHIHAFVKLRERSLLLPKIAEVLGVEAQYIEKPKRGGKAIEGRTQSEDNQLAYLIHAKYPDKFPYAPEQVATVRGEDYCNIYESRKVDWIKGRAIVARQQAKVDVGAIVDAIHEGRITLGNIVLNDDLYRVYRECSLEIDKAFEIVGMRKAFQAAEKLRNGVFKTAIFFFHGPAGSGKTRLATRFLDDLRRRNGWEIYRAASNNPMDDWRGEEIIFLDDVRSSTMAASDWLTLLDPYNASPSSARYRNKQNVAPRVIVLTAPVNPVEFFYYARNKGNMNEALDQFIRRIMATVVPVQCDDLEDTFYNLNFLGLLSDHRALVEARGGVDLAKQMTTFNSYGNDVTRGMTRGVVDTIPCTGEEVFAHLLRMVDEASPDARLSASSDWPEIEQAARYSEGMNDLKAKQILDGPGYWE